jgi:putative restriction endonuclease
MAVKIVVANTDRDWFDQLRVLPDLVEVNFWAPSGERPFRALEQGELLLFKLKTPYNMIVGGGVFIYANALPCSLAWEAFGQANGARSLPEMRDRIARLRHLPAGDRSDFVIGCRILGQPFFLPESDWITPPASWAREIVSFKTYTTEDAEGAALWQQVQERGHRAGRPGLAAREERARFGEPGLVTPRLGQGAFRVLVTDLYDRRCVVTGEKTLPALDAAHIRPYAEGGGHDPSNGLLLRRDIHRLFDMGYVTVTPELRFAVSGRIRQEFENGRAYYSLDGQEVRPPNRPRLRPDPAALRWHNEERFLG